MRSGEFFDICMEEFLWSLILEGCPNIHCCDVNVVSVVEEYKVHVVRYDIAAI